MDKKVPQLEYLEEQELRCMGHWCSGGSLWILCPLCPSGEYDLSTLISSARFSPAVLASRVLPLKGTVYISGTFEDSSIELVFNEYCSKRCWFISF